jgi:uncharacterized protein
MSTTILPFRIEDDAGGGRVIRGKLEGPRGFERASPPLPHVVVIHGFKGFMDWGFFPDVSRRIAGRGAVAVRFNMSGSGVGEDLETFDEPERFETNTISRELEDLARVRDWVRDAAPSGVDRERAALIGHSRGGGVALLHAAGRRDLAALVAWSAVDDVDRHDPETRRLWRARGHLVVENARTGDRLRLGLDALEDLERNRERFDLVAACRRLAVPALLIHGEADEVVPLAGWRRLAAALDPSLHRTITLPGAGHTFGVAHPFTARAGVSGSDRPGREDDWDRVARASLDWIDAHWPPAAGSL